MIRQLRRGRAAELARRQPAALARRGALFRASGVKASGV